MNKFFFHLCCHSPSSGIVPALVLGECACDTENEDRNKSQALKLKFAAIALILVARAIGVCLPMLGKAVPALSPEKNIFFIIKVFAAEVILATGFIHVLPDAFENLTSPCLNENLWGKFPFTGFVAMMAAIDEENDGEAASARVHDSQLLRHRVISQVLELGIVVHSVIIGISLGASESPKTIRPLVAALTFHQFFGGIAAWDWVVVFHRILFSFPTEIVARIFWMAGLVSCFSNYNYTCLSQITHSFAE
ncbi:hypothetical protein EZV62_015563 [Acer yangbiense]|uniref:Uncharacterized protein n=1 Tax=Acer yangbiense TaxID=1000413 RepID=A0A5C7HLH7_9ROSI|nr:hypothetical protein EZV62_015563 [Acer yangbiense]